MKHEYVFVLRGPLKPELRPQAVQIAEAVPEAAARRRLPRLMKFADWLNARPKADQKTLEKRRRRRKWLGLMDLLLGLFALGPVLIAPEELPAFLIFVPICLGAGIGSLWKRHRVLLAVPLILAGFFYGVAGFGGGEAFRILLVFGIALIAVAIAALLPRGRRQKRKNKQAGNQLFDAREAVPDGTDLYVRFTEEGMHIGTKEIPGELLPYSDFCAIIEAEDLLLISVNDRGFLTAKEELTCGNFPAFRKDLSARVTWVHIMQRGNDT